MKIKRGDQVNGSCRQSAFDGEESPAPGQFGAMVVDDDDLVAA